MAKVKDLGMNIAPRMAAGDHPHCADLSGTECAVNEGTCGQDCEGTSGTECAQNEGTCGEDNKHKHPHGYQAFNREIVDQLRQQLEQHLGA